MKTKKVYITGVKILSKNDEIFDDLLEEIDEIQDNFQINTDESTGLIKSQQKPQVVDIKQLKKKQKGLF